MDDRSPRLERRQFLKRAAIGAGVVGAAATIPGVIAGVMPSQASEDEQLAAELVESSEPMVAYLRGGDGDVVLMAGTSEVVVRDRALAARLLRGLRATESSA